MIRTRTITEEVPIEFPESYYETMDPLDRKEILEKALEEEPSQENHLRMELWNCRYGQKSNRKDNQRADAYLRLFMTLKYAAENTVGWFGGRRMRKEILKELELLGFHKMEQEGQTGLDLLYQECYHVTKVFLELCTSDRNYTSALMGMVALKKEQVQGKIAQDIYRVGFDAPQKLGLKTELQILKKASYNAYMDIFPKERGYLEEMISEDME